MENNSALSTEQRDAFRLDAELKHHAGTVVQEMIEIGRCLKEISERRLYEYLGTSTFAEYAKKAVGLKERAAYNYITAYETYGAEGLRKYGELGITKLVALAQLNDADRTEMLESGEAAEISTRALNDRIKELKHETVGINANPAETWDLSLVCEFDDWAGLNVYADHPEHVKVKKIIGEVVDSRACVDSEF